MKEYPQQTMQTYKATTSYATQRNEADLQGVHPPPTPTTSDPWFKSSPESLHLPFHLPSLDASLFAQTLCFQQLHRGPACYTTTTISMFLLIITTNYFLIYLYPINPHHRISYKIFTPFPHSTLLLLFTLLSLQGLLQSLYPPCPHLMRMICWVLMSMLFLRACF